MKIIDNFLPEDEFKIIQDTFLNDELTLLAIYIKY